MSEGIVQYLEAALRETKDAWQRLRHEPAWRVLVLQFLAFLILAILAAEAVIVLVPMLWQALMQTPGYAPLHEPTLRVWALLLGFSAGIWLVYRLIARLRSTVEAVSRTVAPAKVERAIWLLIILLIVESLTAETLIELAGFTVVVERPLALVIAFVLLTGAMLLLAAMALFRARNLVAVRFVDRSAETGRRLEETDGRPPSWPAKVVIAALSTPAKSLRLNSCARLHNYGKFDKPNKDGSFALDTLDRFEFFADPEHTLAQLGRKPGDAESVVDSFNWRPLALAYRAQLPDRDLTPEALPLLVLLCSDESRGFVDDFERFFAWLLAPLAKAHPGFIAESRLLVHDKGVDFEDLDSIEPELRGVHEQACREHGEDKVVIDITGGQRLWAIAALQATACSDARHFSYVPQAPHRDRWIRYYNRGVRDERANDPVGESLGMP